jgi:hypothetical protein
MDSKFLTDHGVDELPIVGQTDTPDNTTEIVFDEAGIPYKVEAGGRASMRLGTPVSETFDDVSWNVLPFDTVTQEKNGFVCDIGNGTITVPRDGIYEVSSGVDAGFSGQEELNLMVFVNDSAYSSQAMAIQGRTANKPVALYWESTVSLSAGDVLDIRGQNGDSGSFNCNILRMIFAVDEAR